MKLTELQIENARENARRFYHESDEESVKKVLATAAYLGSYVEFCHVEKNAFFSCWSEARKEDQNLYDCTEAGYASKVQDNSGWDECIKDFIDISELKRLQNAVIKHLNIEVSVSK